jgi:hypothetical protein
MQVGARSLFQNKNPELDFNDDGNDHDDEITPLFSKQLQRQHHHRTLSPPPLLNPDEFPEEEDDNTCPEGTSFSRQP